MTNINAIQAALGQDKVQEDKKIKLQQCTEQNDTLSDQKENSSEQQQRGTPDSLNLPVSGPDVNRSRRKQPEDKKSDENLLQKGGSPKIPNLNVSPSSGANTPNQSENSDDQKAELLMLGAPSSENILTPKDNTPRSEASQQKPAKKSQQSPQKGREVPGSGSEDDQDDEEESDQGSEEVYLSDRRSQKKKPAQGGGASDAKHRPSDAKRDASDASDAKRDASDAKRDTSDAQADGWSDPKKGAGNESGTLNSSGSQRQIAESEKSGEGREKLKASKSDSRKEELQQSQKFQQQFQLAKLQSQTRNESGGSTPIFQKSAIQSFSKLASFNLQQYGESSHSDFKHCEFQLTSSIKLGDEHSFKYIVGQIIPEQNILVSAQIQNPASIRVKPGAKELELDYEEGQGTGMLCISFPECEFYSPLEQPPGQLELAVSLFVRQPDYRNRLQDIPVTPSTIQTTKFTLQHQTLDYYRYLSSGQSIQISDIAEHITQQLFVKLVVLDANQEHEVGSEEFEFSQLVSAQKNASQSWITLQSEAADYRGIIYFRQQNVFYPDQAKAIHASYLSFIQQKFRLQRTLYLANGEQLTLDVVSPHLVRTMYRVMRLLDADVFQQWQLTDEIRQKNLTLEHYQMINVFLQSVAENNLQKHGLLSQVRNQLWTNLQKSLPKCLVHPTGASLTESEREQVAQYKEEVYDLIQYGVPDEHRLTIWYQFMGISEIVADLQENFQYHIQCAQNRYREMKRSEETQQRSIIIGQAVLSHSALARSSLRQGDHAPRAAGDPFNQREELYRQLQFVAQFTSSQKTQQIQEDLSLIFDACRAESTCRLYPDNLSRDAERRSKLARVMRAFLLACEVTTELNGLWFHKSLLYVLERLSHNVGLAKEHELFWVFFALVKQVLSALYLDDAQIKIDLFALNVVFDSFDDLRAIRLHLEALGVSLEYLFGDALLSVFSAFFTSEMFFRIIDLILIEQLRGRVPRSMVMVSIAITVLKKLEKPLLETRQADKAVFLVRNYCLFNMRYDEFMWSVQRFADAYTFNAATRRYEVPGLLSKFQVFDQSQTLFFKQISDQNCYLYDMIQQKKIEQPSMEQLKSILTAIQNSLTSYNKDSVLNQNFIPKEFYSTFLKQRLSHLHLFIYALSSTKQTCSVSLKTSFMSQHQISRATTLQKIDLYHSFALPDAEDNRDRLDSAPHASNYVVFEVTDLTSQLAENPDTLHGSLNISALKFDTIYRTTVPLFLAKPGNPFSQTFSAVQTCAPVCSEIEVAILLQSAADRSGDRSGDALALQSSALHQVKHRTTFNYFSAPQATDGSRDPYKMVLDYGVYYPYQQEKLFLASIHQNERLLAIRHSEHTYNPFLEWKSNSRINQELYEQIVSTLLLNVNKETSSMIFKLFSQLDNSFYLLDLVLVLTLLSDGTVQQKLDLLFNFMLLFEKRHSHYLTSETVQSFLIAVFERLKFYYPQHFLVRAECLLRKGEIPFIRQALFVPDRFYQVQTSFDVTEFIKKQYLHEIFGANLKCSLVVSDEQFLQQLSTHLKRVSGQIYSGTLKIQYRLRNFVRDFEVDLCIQSNQLYPKQMIGTRVFTKRINYQIADLLSYDRFLLTLRDERLYDIHAFKDTMYQMPLLAYIFTLYSEVEPQTAIALSEQLLCVNVLIKVDAEDSLSLKLIDRKFQLISNVINPEGAEDIVYVEHLDEHTRLESLVEQSAQLVEERTGKSVKTCAYKLEYIDFSSKCHLVEQNSHFSRQTLAGCGDLEHLLISFQTQKQKPSAKEADAAAQGVSALHYCRLQSITSPLFQKYHPCAIVNYEGELRKNQQVLVKVTDTDQDLLILSDVSNILALDLLDSANNMQSQHTQTTL